MRKTIATVLLTGMLGVASVAFTTGPAGAHGIKCAKGYSHHVGANHSKVVCFPRFR